MPSRLAFSKVEIWALLVQGDTLYYAINMNTTSSIPTFPLEMHHLFRWEMLGISQAGVGQLLAGGLVSISALHKVPYLVPAHRVAVAQWEVSQPVLVMVRIWNNYKCRVMIFFNCEEAFRDWGSIAPCIPHLQSIEMLCLLYQECAGCASFWCSAEMVALVPGNNDPQNAQLWFNLRLSATLS